MHNFVDEMLHGSPAAQRILALWQEYEEQRTEEARFVKGTPNFAHLDYSLLIPADLDRFEMACQGNLKLGSSWKDTLRS
jgi:hypothetical protein